MNLCGESHHAGPRLSERSGLVRRNYGGGSRYRGFVGRGDVTGARPVKFFEKDSGADLSAGILADLTGVVNLTRSVYDAQLMRSIYCHHGLVAFQSPGMLPMESQFGCAHILVNPANAGRRK